MSQHDLLLLENQLCFPLYATSRLVTRMYQPLLEPLGLTYPQYIVLMILWANAPCSVSKIGTLAQLASNTLTPLLKRLEQQGLITRERDPDDERKVTIAPTGAGWAIKNRCAEIPLTLCERIDYPQEELLELKKQLEKLMRHLQAQEA
jgi:DNA-binding MarR family transcriptional regulator